MENKIDQKMYPLVFAIAMSKTKFLQKIPAELDGDARISVPFLIPIALATPSDFLRQLNLTHLEVLRRYNSNINFSVAGQTYSFQKHHLIWGRMYVIAYFFLHDDPFWKKIGFAEMKALEKGEYINQDMATAMKYIDEYYAKVANIEQMDFNHTADNRSDEYTQAQTRIKELEARIKELEQQLEEVQGKSTANGPTDKQLEETFTYPYRQKQGYSLLIDFLMQEVITASDIEWARHALAIFDNTPSVILNKPADFKSWLVNFCNLFNRKWVRDYEPEKLRNVKGKRAKKSKVYSFLPNN